MQQTVTQMDVIRRMSMEQRWRVAHDLYVTAREWKAAALRTFHPDWSEAAILDAVRRSFQHGGR